MLTNYFNAKFIKEHGIPYYVFNEARGVMFLSYWKAGLVIGASYGTGILLSKWNNKWCGPCAISLAGCEVGLEIGIEKVDYILVIHDDTILRLFGNKGVFTIGADASIAAGSFGKDSNMLTKGSSSISAYSFAKGAYLGVSLESGIISFAKNWNEEYYLKPVKMNEIVYGEVTIPQNKYYLSLTNLLDQYYLNKSENTDNIIVDKEENSTKPIKT
jgi:lipid-binding SYLF domain-containing protein